MTLVTLEALLSNWINLEQSLWRQQSSPAKQGLHTRDPFSPTWINLEQSLWRQQSSPAEQGLHTRDSFTDLEQSFIFQSIQEQTGTDQFYPEV